MAKKKTETEKRLTLKDIETAVNGNLERNKPQVIKWHDIDIIVRPTISLGSMMALVSGVVDACFDDEGQYHPEVKQYATETSIITYYTNFPVLDDADKDYFLHRSCDIFECATAYINSAQLYDDIYVGIEDQIKTRLSHDEKQFEKQAQKLFDQFEEMTDMLSNTFGELSKDDITMLQKSLTEDGAIDEGKIAAAVLDKMHAEHKDTETEKS